MASLRDIRRKIGSVKNIAKITQAMKMVAVAKLRRAQDRVAAARPYAERMKAMLDQVAPVVPAEVVARHPLLLRREAGRVAVVIISGNRGMCGSYNNNITRLGLQFVAEREAEGQTVELVTIGRYAGRAARRRDREPVVSFDMIDVDSPFSEVQVITQALVGLYTRAEDPVSELHIAYSAFVNAVTQRPTVERFLPIEPEGVAAGERGETPAFPVDFEFDPTAETLLETLLPRYVDNQVYQYLLEATASEYGARMTAMSKASDNAAELIGTLTLQYNRARQDAITKEILDIVGGAEALAGE